MKFSTEIQTSAKKLISQLSAHNMTIVTAESCTGGLIGAALTSVAGSSTAVHGGFITYANTAKIKMLSVNPATLDAYGAVSEQTAIEMCLGAQKNTNVDVAVAVTGIAGPGGGNAAKPVGLVYISCAHPSGTTCREFRFGDIGRAVIREKTVLHALNLAIEALHPAA